MHPIINQEAVMFTGITVNDLLLKIEQIIDAKISSHLQSSKKNQSEYLTRKEVSKLLKITLPTLHEWTKLGWVIAYKAGNRVLYKQHEVEQAMQQVLSAKNRRVKSW
jgi:excisionase family DNA binding protein